MASPKKKTPANPETVRAMLAEYRQADAELTAAREAVDRAMAKRTLTVKAIVDTVGPGPYQFDGKTVKATRRDIKDENKVVTGTTWFFTSIGDEVMTLD